MEGPVPERTERERGNEAEGGIPQSPTVSASARKRKPGRPEKSNKIKNKSAANHAKKHKNFVKKSKKLRVSIDRNVLVCYSVSIHRSVVGGMII